MKKERLAYLKASMAALVVASLMLTIASATPSPPHAFYGTLYADGSPAGAGAELRAKVGGIDVTENSTNPEPYITTVDGEYGSGLSRLLVDCETDDVITFWVDSREANEQFTCKRGQVNELPLTVGDGNPECTDGETQPCYEGPEGTEGLGLCASGIKTCVSGFWGSCQGQVIPEEEVCDGEDNNCNDETDEGLTTTYYEDSDGDGYGNLNSPMEACAPLEGYVENTDDCDDSDPEVNPGSQEVCDNAKDDDCNGYTDCLDGACEEADACDTTCIDITSLTVLDESMEEATEIVPGALYHVKSVNFNDCQHDLLSMQIIQIQTDNETVNIGTLTSVIEGYDENTVTVGFIMPEGTEPGTEFTASAFNWNIWIGLDPGNWEALSETAEVSFSTGE